MSKNIQKEFVNNQLKFCKDADEKILYFIADFLYHSGVENAEIIRNQFRNGYCYYFAHILQNAFNCGEVCIAAPIGHFVWMKDNIPYDIEGINNSDCEYYIPEKFLGDAKKDFLHIRGVANNTTEEQIQEIIETYKKYRIYNGG